MASKDPRSIATAACTSSTSSVRGSFGVVSPTGKAELLVALPDGSIANGIRFGPPATADVSKSAAWSGPLVMYVADYTKEILRIDPNDEGRDGLRARAFDESAERPGYCRGRTAVRERPELEG